MLPARGAGFSFFTGVKPMEADWPKIVNHLIYSAPSIEPFPHTFYSGYPEKVVEVERILGFKIRSVHLPPVQEIQSKDPYKVAQEKAIAAWRLNQGNPVIVEDTSLWVMAMDGLPGPYTADFTATVDQRRVICLICRHKKDYRVKAQVIIAVYDGQKVSFREGITHGRISSEPRGLHGFGWDDIFIPDGSALTFAEMVPEEKDKFSMRQKAWSLLRSQPFSLEQPIYELVEPFDEEMDRIRHEEFSPNARHFATLLEFMPEVKPSQDHSFLRYLPIQEESTKFFKRYIWDKNSPSLGLILTNIDLHRVSRHQNGTPMFWQMGPQRRHLALALRSLYYDQNQNPETYQIIHNLETGRVRIPARPNFRQPTVEQALGLTNGHASPVYTPAISEIGYNKISSPQLLSRRQATQKGLFNRIGKHVRRVVGLGSMPPVTGWRDTLVMALIGHMVAFVPRNSLFAADIDRRLSLIKAVRSVISQLPLEPSQKQVTLRNLGASLSADNPEAELVIARKLYNQGKIHLFRIYTIASDPRVIKLARLLREEFGDDIEIFVGQVADKTQALELISPKIRADALILGHGGGRQCTSAINGMAITTLEDLYSLVTDKRFNSTALILEGGVSRSIGTALLLGADAVLYNQQFVHGTIETGDLFVQDLKGRICQPYPGSASPVTQIIESQYESLRLRRTDAAGRTLHPEGKPGFMYYEDKAPSMAFWVNEFLGHAGRMMADLGVLNMTELRSLLNQESSQFLRIMTEKTQYLSDAYGNGK